LVRLDVVVRYLDKTLKTEVNSCVDSTINATFKDKKYAEAALKGCIRSSFTLDEKTRDALVSAIDEAKVSEDEYKGWLGCAFPLQKPTVVLMDSHLPDVVYCPHTQQIGGSNADDISKLLSDLPISINAVSTNLEWQDDQRVANLNPVLIVVHASAFYKETREMEGNTRLLEFLNGMKNVRTKILVYTRGLPDQPTSGVRDRWNRLLERLGDPELKGKATLFVMPKGHASCFTDPDVGRPFKNTVKDLLELK
jgi:hypothetical protein